MRRPVRIVAKEVADARKKKPSLASIFLVTSGAHERWRQRPGRQCLTPRQKGWFGLNLYHQRFIAVLCKGSAKVLARVELSRSRSHLALSKPQTPRATRLYNRRYNERNMMFNAW